MRKILKIALSLLVSFTCITPFLVKNVNAATTDISVPYQEPSTSDNQGYISVLFENNSSGKLFVMTWIWNITNESASGGNSGMQVSVSDTSIKFVSQLPTGEKGYSLIYSYNSGGNNITVNQYKYFTTTCEEYKYTTSSYTIRGFQAKGNVKYLIDEVSNPSAFAIRWGDDKLLTNKIDSLIDTIETLGITDSSILSEIETISGDLATIKTKINSIYTKVATIDTNVLNIYNQMVVANDWLDSIREGISLSNGYLIEIRNILSEKLQSINDDLNTGLENVVTRIGNFQSYLMNWLQSNFQTLMNQLFTMSGQLRDIINLLSTDKDLSSDVESGEETNDNLNENVNDYIDLESNFHTDMNESLNKIDTDIELFGNNDFIKTATFISTNINRVVTSNTYYNAFVITGLVLGIALVMIGKKVI